MLVAHMPDSGRPRPEARRLLAADLFAQDKSYIEVARLLGVSEEAARKWKLRYEAGGREALRERREGKRGPTSPITDKQAHALMREAKKASATTIAALCALAEKRGHEVSRSALRRKLIALGYWPAGDAD
jgi:transposase